MLTFIEKLIKRETPAEPKARTAAKIIPKTPGRDRRFGELIAFHLDDDSLQYCFCKKQFSKLSLVDFGKIYLPASEKDSDLPFVFFKEEIRRLCLDNDFRSPRYALSLPSNQTALRTLRIPKMSPDELRQAVFFEGSKKTPFRLEDAYWNYRITEELITDKTHYLNISLIAVSSGYVEDRLSFFADLGIDFDFIYQDAEALGFSLRRLPGFSEDLPYGLLNIRPSYTHIALYQGSRLKFMHRGNIGSVAFGSSSAADIGAESLFPQQMDNFTEGLVTEIQNCLDFYGTQAGFDQIDTFYVYGDLTYSEDLIDRLVDRFGIKFVRFPSDAFSSAHVVNEIQADTISTVLPALATATSGYLLTDLTAPAVREERKLKRFKRFALQVGVITVIALAGMWQISRMQLAGAKYNHDSIAAQVVRFERSPAYAGYRVIKQELARQQSIIDRLKRDDTQHYLALKEIAALTPPTIRLKYFQYFPRNIGKLTYVSGEVVTSSLAPEVSLADYIGRLDGSPLFSAVTLERHNKSIKGATRTVTFTLNMRAEL